MSVILAKKQKNNLEIFIVIKLFIYIGNSQKTIRRKILCQN